MAIMRETEREKIYDWEIESKSYFKKRERLTKAWIIMSTENGEKTKLIVCCCYKKFTYFCVLIKIA